METQIRKNTMLSNVPFSTLVLISGKEETIGAVSELGTADRNAFHLVFLDTLPGRQRKNRQGLRPADRIVLVDLSEGSGFTPLSLTHIRRIFSNTPVFALAEAWSPSLVKNAFLFGADGFLTGGDVSVKLMRHLSEFRKSGHPPVSKEIIPWLISHAQGSMYSEKRFSELSVVQQQIARLMVAGNSYQEAADAMQMGLDNLRYHVKTIYRKLGIDNKMGLTAFVGQEV